MKTKEQILNEVTQRDAGQTFVNILKETSNENLINDSEVIQESVYEAMDEWAKHVSVDFASYLRKWYVNYAFGWKANGIKATKTNEVFITEQVFDEYLQSKQQ